MNFYKLCSLYLVSGSVRWEERERESEWGVTWDGKTMEGIWLSRSYQATFCRKIWRCTHKIGINAKNTAKKDISYKWIKFIWTFSLPKPTAKENFWQDLDSAFDLNSWLVKHLQVKQYCHTKGLNDAETISCHSQHLLEDTGYNIPRVTVPWKISPSLKHLLVIQIIYQAPGSNKCQESAKITNDNNVIKLAS